MRGVANSIKFERHPGPQVPRSSTAWPSPISGFPKIRGTLLGGPYNKDCSIFGSILGSFYVGKLPYRGHKQRAFKVPQQLKEGAPHKINQGAFVRFDTPLGGVWPARHRWVSYPAFQCVHHALQPGQVSGQLWEGEGKVPMGVILGFYVGF